MTELLANQASSPDHVCQKGPLSTAKINSCFTNFSVKLIITFQRNIEPATDELIIKTVFKIIAFYYIND